MKKVMTFGRNEDNDVVLPHEDISRYHAKITMVDDGNTFWVEDLDSTNHTYVNSMRIQKARVDKNDIIELSKHTIDLRSIFGLANELVKQNPLDYTAEFLELKKTQVEHEQAMDRLDNKYFKRTAIARSIIIFTPQLICFVLHILTESDKNSISVYSSPVYYIITALSAIIGTWWNPKSKKYVEQKKQINIDYYIRWVCPKCRKQLPLQPWEALNHREVCHHGTCNAIWNKTVKA